MAVTAPPRGIGTSLQNRQARPLNGLEVQKAVVTHIIDLATRMLNGSDILSDQAVVLLDALGESVRDRLAQQSRLQKINVTYPKVGWSVKTRLERLDDETPVLNAEVELDLERNVRLNIQFGRTGDGIVISSMEDEKIATITPDRDRQSFGLKIEADYIRPDGTTGKVDINDLKRAARSVDTGSGANTTHVVQMVDPQDLEKTIEVKLGGGQQGQEIVIPPDDLVAEPPEPPKEPLKIPLPDPKSMAAVKRPDVKLKGGK